MKKIQMSVLIVFLSTALLGLISLLTYNAGRGDCPQCGHTSDLHACKHCGWKACLSCWQGLSKYDTCPGCGRSSP